MNDMHVNYNASNQAFQAAEERTGRLEEAMDLPDFALRPAPARRGPVPVSVLETTCEGVWLLQALCGVETLSVLLALRPYVATVGPPMSHPGIAILAEAGALLDDQTVHPRIADWIEV